MHDLTETQKSVIKQETSGQKPEVFYCLNTDKNPPGEVLDKYYYTTLKGNSMKHAANAIEFIEGRYEVDEGTGCWNWKGKLLKGYGNSKICGIRWGDRRIHRLSYRFYKMNGQKLEDGILIRHMCHNKKCINPDHLLPGTGIENHDDTKRLKYDAIDLNFEEMRVDFDLFIENLIEKHSIDQKKALSLVNYCLKREIKYRNKDD